MNKSIMPDIPDNSKYEARVRQRAEEMAAASWKGSTPWREIHRKETYIDLLIPVARLAVQREAEAYREGYSIGRDMENDPYSRSGLATMLKSLGLIPSLEKTKG